MAGMRESGLLMAILASAALVGGCRGKSADKNASPAPAPAPAPAVPATAPAGAAAVELPWIEDDYDAALARAREADKPVLIDMWAAWCHTCLSMKHTVLADPSLASWAERFVWLAIDTENPATADAQARFPVQVWPTFYVVSSVDDSVQARHQGAASVEQFRALLAEGERGHTDALASGGKLADDDPQYLARLGDRAAARGDWADAARHYGAAVAESSTDWLRRPDVLVGLASALARAEDYETCVAFGRTRMPDTGTSASAADFVHWTTRCADNLPADNAASVEAAAALRASAARRLEGLVDNDKAPLSTDDRADAMRILREVYVAQGRDSDARAVAQRQRALLEAAARDAGGPFELMTFHWPRLEVALYLNDAGLLATLENAFRQSEKDLPREYDPPYRLASLLHARGRHDEALVAAQRARERVYGPRTANVLDLIARIENARGNVSGERAARQAIVALWQSLPAGQRRSEKLEAAREALAAMK